MVAIVIAACRIAGRADDTSTLAGGPEGRTVREGLVIWERADSGSGSRRRRLTGNHRRGLTAHGLH